MQTLQIDEFLRSLKQNIDAPHSLLLGAGASIESGIPSANDCIWDWKKEIFLSQNPSAIGIYDNVKSERVRRVIQHWLNSQNTYPIENSEEEYSFYAEKAYPIADDRRKYFQHLVAGHDASIGYHLISMLALENIVKSVWTTNFDGLMFKCAHQYSPLVPVEITSETSKRIYRGDVNQELLCISLHGDYKYGALKNTAEELDTQDGELEKALLHELTNRDLIVIGYSGRDHSLMDALTRVYSSNGAGKLFWCGYGSNALQTVSNLIDTANKSGRDAYYIPTNGFDSTIYAIARHCMSEKRFFLSKVDNIKERLSATITPKIANFLPPNSSPEKLVDTNVFPISFPKNCYQFSIGFNQSENAWDFCKELKESSIMAVPYKGMIYAWGTKDTIVNICRNKLESSVELCPLTRDTILKNGVFRELLLKTVTNILASAHGLNCSRNRIWDTNDSMQCVINGNTVTAFSGVKLSLFFDKKYTYLTISPSYMLENGIILSSEEKKIFSDWFFSHVNNGKPNFNANKHIKRWTDKIIGHQRFIATYPINTSSCFNFTIGNNSALLGISSRNVEATILPASISTKRIIFHGSEYKDPTLTFYNPSMHRLVEDFHPMRGLRDNAPVDHTINSTILRPSISIGIICPHGHENIFSQFIYGLNQSSLVRHNPDYLISFPGFHKAFHTGIDLPKPYSDRWMEITEFNRLDIHQSFVVFRNTIIRKIDQLSTLSVDVILIYIPKEYEIFTSYSEGALHYDLHDYIKAYAAQKQVATQFIRERTIESDLHCQIMWSLSLAFYVKSGRIPWTVTGIQPDTAFAGIGYSVINGSSGNNIVVGCSHIYSSDGQGLKYKLSKIHDFTLDRKKNPYLTEEEAYRIGLNTKELFYKSFSVLPKRVVIHKRTPFHKEEIKGLVESLSCAGIKDVELLEITYEDNLKCFALNSSFTQADGFPVRRGLCFPINEKTIYLYTHGIAPSIISQTRKYFQGGKSVPMPLKIVQHYGSGNISQIATEVLGLSKMNWNSFGLYSKLPCTIESSNEIARIGWLLSQYEGALYDYRYFM